MVASQDRDSLWVSNLQGYEQGDRLHRIISTIYIVAHEEVVGIRVRASDPEQLHQVVELTVDVTTHRYGAPLANSVNNVVVTYGITTRYIPLAGHSTRLEGFL